MFDVDINALHQPESVLCTEHMVQLAQVDVPGTSTWARHNREYVVHLPQGQTPSELGFWH